MGKRKDAHLTAIRRALDRAEDLGLNEMDWVGTGSSQRVANEEQAAYLIVIRAGIEAFDELHGVTAGATPGSPL